jgi:hypothetical protein
MITLLFEGGLKNTGEVHRSPADNPFSDSRKHNRGKTFSMAEKFITVQIRNANANLYEFYIYVLRHLPPWKPISLIFLPIDYDSSYLLFFPAE